MGEPERAPGGRTSKSAQKLSRLGSAWTGRKLRSGAGHTRTGRTTFDLDARRLAPSAK